MREKENERESERMIERDRDGDREGQYKYIFLNTLTSHRFLYYHMTKLAFF